MRWSSSWRRLCNAAVVRHKGYSERDSADIVDNLRLSISKTNSLNEMAQTGRPVVIADTHAYTGREWAVSWIRSFKRPI